MTEIFAFLVVVLSGAGDPCRVVAALDVLRAAAWRADDREALDQVYGAGAGAADVALLDDYGKRGLRVRTLSVRRESCRAVTERSAEVVERLGDVVVEQPDGSVLTLPADDWDRRRIEVRQVDGRWRLVASRTIRSAGAAAAQGRA